jgi:hypothetical protein
MLQRALQLLTAGAIFMLGVRFFRPIVVLSRTGEPKCIVERSLKFASGTAARKMGEGLGMIVLVRLQFQNQTWSLIRSTNRKHRLEYA